MRSWLVRSSSRAGVIVMPPKPEVFRRRLGVCGVIEDVPLLGEGTSSDDMVRLRGNGGGESLASSI